MALIADLSYGYPGTVNASKLAVWLPHASASTYGILGENHLKVTLGGSGDRAVTVAAGTAWGDGVLDIWNTGANLNHAAVSSGTTRWDMIVIRRTWNPTAGLSVTTLAIVQGNDQRTLPARANNPGTLSEQPIALVRLSSTQTAAQEVVDLRCWAGNGGAVAHDILVQNYLTDMGTRLWIAGVEYQRATVDANASIAWTKVSQLGRIPLLGNGATLFGGTPAAGTFFAPTGGTFTAGTDPDGYSRFSFPNPFPTGLLTVLLFNGDDFAAPGARYAAAGNSAFWGSPGFGNKVEVVYSMRDANGALWPSKQHRVNWIALGW